MNQQQQPPSTIEKTMPWALFVLGMWYFCIRILGYQFDYLPGDLGDSRFINYLLEHGYQWVTQKTDAFWTAHFMHPFQNTLALSDTLIGAQFFYLPWRLLGFSMSTSYQLWWLTICTLNYWVAYWVFKQLFKKTGPATILAYVFAFTILNLGQLNYMQMIIRFPIALAFYAAFQLASHFSLKHLTLYFFAVLWQFYCVPYTGFYLFYFSLLFLFVYLVFTKDLKNTLRTYFNQQNRFKTTGAVLLFGWLLSFLLWPYYRMADTVGLRLYAEVVPYVPKLQSYFLAHEASLPWQFLYEATHKGLSNWWLHTVFPGMLLLVTLIGATGYFVFMRLKKQPVDVRFKSLLTVALVLALLHLKIGEHLTLYGLIFKLPGINSIRVPGRFMQVELFLLLMLLGFFLTAINSKLWLIYLLLVFIDNSFDAEKITRTSKAHNQQTLNSLKQQVLADPNYKQKTLAVIDTLRPAFETHLDAMLVAQELGLKSFNGYSSYCPDAFGAYFTKCSEQGLNQWLENQSLTAEPILLIKRTH